jgi:hypothetical protein
VLSKIRRINGIFYIKGRENKIPSNKKIKNKIEIEFQMVQIKIEIEEKTEK